MPHRPVARRSRSPRLACSAIGFLLASVSCAPWTSIPAPAPVSFPPASQVQVWSHGHGVVLRDLSITEDSIRGRAVDPLGPGAWVAMPRAEADSFRIRPEDQANWFGAGVGGGLLIGVVGTMALCRAAMGS